MPWLLPRVDPQALKLVHSSIPAELRARLGILPLSVAVQERLDVSASPLQSVHSPMLDTLNQTLHSTQLWNALHQVPTHSSCCVKRYGPCERKHRCCLLTHAGQ